MAELNGYVKLHRRLLGWGWYSDPVVKAVFLHLLLTASFRPSTYMGYELQPGQVIVGRKRLAAELGFSEKQIRTALDKLEKTGEISRKRTNKFTLITIENWAFYQGEEDDKGQQKANEGPTKGQQEAIKGPHLKNVKNVKNVKNNKNIVQSDANKVFEDLWKLYPQKRGKGKVSDAKKREIYEVGFDEMSRAIQRYIEDLKKESWREPQNGSTFFNSGYVDYLDKNYSPNKNKGVNSDGQYGENAGDSEPSPWGELSGITRC